jgi:hypothetical protein
MNTYEIREKGKEHCETKGSEHYHTTNVEPLDLIISLGLAEGFCLGSIIKYGSRFQRTQNLNDLKKIADYAHILCGVKLQEGEK